MDKKVKEIKGHKIIELSGSIDFYCVETLRKFIFKFVKKKVPSIILDLKSISYMDSSGIGLFVTIQKAMGKYGGKIGLLNANKDIMDLLKLAAIDALFKIYASQDEIEYRS